MSWATAGERVVAVCLQRLCRRRVFVSMPVLVRGGGVVGDERGT